MVKIVKAVVVKIAHTAMVKIAGNWRKERIVA